MATYRYIIRRNSSAINNDGTTLIHLRYTDRGQTTYFSSGIKILPIYWDQEKQCVKRSYKGFSTINILLSKFRQEFEDILNKTIYDGIKPTPEYIRMQHDNLKNPNKVKREKEGIQLSFEKFVDAFIEESKRVKKKPTIRSYTDFVRILGLYKKSRHIRTLHWHDFTMDWYYDFMDFYIEERGANNNTFGKMVKTLKTFLNAGVQQGYNQNLTFKDKRFRVYQEDVSHIYLNEEEIRTILDLDLSANGRMETVRDLFVIGCYTGLRFGDFKQINEKNIMDNRLRVKTQKTGKYVVIPFHPIVKSIIQKYDGKLPKAYSNSVINMELKKIGKKAGLTGTVIQVRTHGIERKETAYEKWQLISTHCARRSFATNLFKQGFPAISIMKITGHKSEKTFMRYIKVTEDEVASMLEQHWNKNYKQAV